MSTVLLVEDDFGVGHAVEELLADEGYVVVRAINGREALRLLATMQRPDVILLDLLMPVMNGTQFLQAMRQDARWADIPVVVASAHANAPLPVRATLRKPYSADVLLDTLADILCSTYVELRKAG